MTADRWQHTLDCEHYYSTQTGPRPCDCGLSALRDAVAAGDREPLYRVVRPLPDAPEVSP